MGHLGSRQTTTKSNHVVARPRPSRTTRTRILSAGLDLTLYHSVVVLDDIKILGTLRAKQVGPLRLASATNGRSRMAILEKQRLIANKQQLIANRLDDAVSKQATWSREERASQRKNFEKLRRDLDRKLDQQNLLLRRPECLVAKDNTNAPKNEVLPPSQSADAVPAETDKPSRTRSESVSCQASIDSAHQDSTTVDRSSTLQYMAEVRKDILVSEICPVYNGPKSTVCCEWNKFVLVGDGPDKASEIYD